MKAKTIIIAATTVAITSVAVLAIDTVSDWREQSRLADIEARARADLFALAEAGPGDDDKVAAFCRSVAELVETGQTTSEIARPTLHNCRHFKFL